ILVTAVGADPKSAVFYSRVKGETEDGVGALGFSRLDIVRPGLILGPRSERRPSEAFFQKLAPKLSPLLPSFLDRYEGISADTIAAAIARLAGVGGEGLHVHMNRSLKQLAPI
ncbi:MAG: hypothetical protein ACRC1J_09580, partial [Sandaracinobacteroides sp.]